MPMTLNQNLTTIDARIRSLGLSSEGNLDIISDKIVKEKSTERAYETFNHLVGVGRAGTVGEGSAYSEKTPIQGNSRTLTVTKKGFRIGATKEQVDDNLFSPIASEVGQAGRNSMIETKELEALNLLNNGFATTYQTTPDSVALFSSAHVLVQGGTQSNTATAAALDLDNLWTGINTMQTSKDDSGLYASLYKPKYLVVPQQLQRKAGELTRSTLVPHLMENQTNVVKDLYPLQVLTSPLLSSTTAWFLTADPSKVTYYGLVRLMREKFSIIRNFVLNDSEVGGGLEDKDIFFWKFRERYIHGLLHWQGLFGNAGA